MGNTQSGGESFLELAKEKVLSGVEGGINQFLVGRFKPILKNFLVNDFEFSSPGSMENLAFDPVKINDLLERIPFSFSSLRVGELRVENIESSTEFKLRVVLQSIEATIYLKSEFVNGPAKTYDTQFEDPNVDEFKGLQSAEFKSISQDWLGKVDAIEARNFNLILRVDDALTGQPQGERGATDAMMDGFVVHIPALKMDNAPDAQSVTFDSFTLGSFAGVDSHFASHNIKSQPVLELLGSSDAATLKVLDDFSRYVCRLARVKCTASHHQLRVLMSLFDRVNVFLLSVVEKQKLANSFTLQLLDGIGFDLTSRKQAEARPLHESGPHANPMAVSELALSLSRSDSDDDERDASANGADHVGEKTVHVPMPAPVELRYDVAVGEIELLLHHDRGEAFVDKDSMEGIAVKIENVNIDTNYSDLSKRFHMQLESLTLTESRLGYYGFEKTSSISLLQFDSKKCVDVLISQVCELNETREKRLISEDVVIKAGYLYAVFDPGLVQRVLKLVEPITAKIGNEADAKPAGNLSFSRTDESTSKVTCELEGHCFLTIKVPRALADSDQTDGKASSFYRKESIVFECQLPRIDILFSGEKQAKNTQYILDFNQFKFWLDFRESNVNSSLMAVENSLSSSSETQPRGRSVNAARLSELKKLGEINKCVGGDRQAIVVTCKTVAKRLFEHRHVRDSAGAKKRIDSSRMVYPPAQGTVDEANLFKFHVSESHASPFGGFISIFEGERVPQLVDDLEYTQFVQTVQAESHVFTEIYIASADIAIEKDHYGLLMTLLDSLADDLARQSSPADSLNANNNGNNATATRPRKASEGLGRGLGLAGRERSGSSAMDAEDYAMAQLAGSKSVTSARVCVEFVTVNLSERSEALHRSFEIELREFDMLLTRNYQDKTYTCVDTSSIKVDVYEKRADGQPTRTCVLQSSGPVISRSESILNEKYAPKAFQLRVMKYLGGSGTRGLASGTLSTMNYFAVNDIVLEYHKGMNWLVQLGSFFDSPNFQSNDVDEASDAASGVPSEPAPVPSEPATLPIRASRRRKTESKTYIMLNRCEVPYSPSASLQSILNNTGTAATTGHLDSDAASNHSAQSHSAANLRRPSQSARPAMRASATRAGVAARMSNSSAMVSFSSGCNGVDFVSSPLRVTAYGTQLSVIKGQQEAQVGWLDHLQLDVDLTYSRSLVVSNTLFKIDAYSDSLRLFQVLVQDWLTDGAKVDDIKANSLRRRDDATHESTAHRESEQSGSSGPQNKFVNLIAKNLGFTFRTFNIEPEKVDFSLQDLDLIEHEIVKEKEKKTNIFSFTESRNRITKKIKLSFHLEERKRVEPNLTAVAAHRLRAYMHNFKIFIHERVYNLALDFWSQFQSPKHALAAIATELPDAASQADQSGIAEADEKRVADPALLARERSRELTDANANRPYFNFEYFKIREIEFYVKFGAVSLVENISTRPASLFLIFNLLPCDYYKISFMKLDWQSATQQAVMHHYTAEFKRQSLMYLPTAFKGIKPLVDSIQGVYEIVVTPIQYYNDNGDLVKGVSLGVRSGTSKVLSSLTGVTNMVTMLLNTVSPKETADGSQMYLTEALRESKVAVMDSVYDMVNGLVTVPVETYQRDGILGSLGSFLYGLPSSVLSPVRGFTTGMTYVLHGAQNSIMGNNEPK